MEVIGLSFDGDPSYLYYVNNMCSQIGQLTKLNLKLPLSSIFTEYSGILIFQDALRLVKFCS
ncbi:hypothetical protein M9Y10_029695 [Tritrichomonas musculus]|uniref:Uncharacterized protein n=1 Tax=Tritrichomonas musculus TaxID=1915356 RepID=A0ABR2KN12_9EUKA